MAASQQPPGGQAPSRPGCSLAITGSGFHMPEVAPFRCGDGSGLAAAARIGESFRLPARRRGLRGAGRLPPFSRSLLLRWRKVGGCFGSGTAGLGGEELRAAWWGGRRPAAKPEGWGCAGPAASPSGEAFWSASVQRGPNALGHARGTRAAVTGVGLHRGGGLVAPRMGARGRQPPGRLQGPRAAVASREGKWGRNRASSVLLSAWPSGVRLQLLLRSKSRGNRLLLSFLLLLPL